MLDVTIKLFAVVFMTVVTIANYVHIEQPVEPLNAHASRNGPHRSMVGEIAEYDYSDKLGIEKAEQ